MKDRSVPDTIKRTHVFNKVIVAAFAVVIVQLFILQVRDHDFYRSKSSAQQTNTIELLPDRGDIYDRNGNILATSVDRWSIYVRPRAIENKAEVVGALVSILPEKKGLIEKKFTDRLNFWLVRKAEKHIADAVKRLRSTGIDITREKKRIYPKGRLAGQLIGFVGVDNQGLSGIELGFDRSLVGVPGKYVFESDPRGRQIFTGNYRELTSPRPGMNLYLTIDENIQYVAESSLAEGIKKMGAIGGTITVIDVLTGDILAIASMPDFNPNEYSKFDASRWKLKPVTDLYEPGSTFKVITAAAGIEERIVDLDSKIPVPDVLKVGGIKIENSHRVIRDKPFKTLRDVLAESLNTGTSYIGLKLGARAFYKHIRAFGFGSLTGVEYPGEQAGIVKKPARWHKSDEATITFGQSVSVTPVQLVYAVASIGNKGIRMAPKLIRKVESQDEAIIRSDFPMEAGRTISEVSVKKMIELMKGSVYMKHSSGKYARMPQYSAAGKTGTAQKVMDGRYVKGKYISSFVGIAPASSPRIAVLVTVDEPKASIWGEVAAAPVFRQTAEFTLRYLNIPPDL